MPHVKIAGAGLNLFRKLRRKNEDKRHDHDNTEANEKKRSRSNDLGDASADFRQFNELARSFVEQHQAHHNANKTDGDKALGIAKRGVFWSAVATVFAFLAAAGAIGSVIYAQRQLSEARNENRAWVGAFGAKLNAALTPNNPIEATIYYGNVGKAPATHFAQLSGSHFWTVNQWNNGEAIKELSEWARHCLASDGNNAYGSVVFPYGSSPNSINYNTSTNLVPGQVGRVVPTDFWNRKQIFTAVECFVYRNEDAVRHTSSCFFFEAGTTDPNNLSICASGNEAD